MTLLFRRPDQLLVILYDCDAPVWSRVKKRDSDSLISGTRHQKHTSKKPLSTKCRLFRRFKSRRRRV